MSKKTKPAETAEADLPEQTLPQDAARLLPPAATIKIPRRMPHELADAINGLPVGGQYFYKIRRRLPGSALVSIIRRKLPIDEVDDLEGFCYGECGTDEFPGEQCDFKIEIVDAKEQRVFGPSEIQHKVEPRKGSVPGRPGASPADPALVNEAVELARRKEKLRLRREEIALRKEEQRIERAEDGAEGYDDGYGEGGDPASGYVPGALWDPRSRRWIYQGGGRHPGDFQRVDPEIHRLEKENDDLKRKMERLEDKINQAPRESAVDTMLKLLPFFQQEGLKPKDMIGMMGGMMSQIGQINAEATKSVMTLSAESEKEFRKRMWDFALASGDDDIIDRVRKWVDVGEEGVTKMLRIGLGRTTIKPGEKVGVPVLNKAPAKPALPAAKGPAPAQAQAAAANPAAPAAAALPEAVEKQTSPEEEVKTRIETFLKVHEQQMLTEADPVLIADKLDELYLLFPGPVRVKIEASEIGDIYEELRKYAPEIVDRILLANDDLKAQDKEKAKRYQEWVLAFWEAIKNPEGEDDGGEDDRDGDDPAEDDPGPDETSDQPAPGEAEPKE